MIGDIKNTIGLLLTLLDLALKTAYYDQEIPSDIDKEIIQIMSGLTQFHNEDIELLSSRIVGDKASILGLFSERMASLAVRQNNVKFVEHGLLALLICSQSEDSKEVLLSLCLLYDAILKTSEDPEKIFVQVGSLFSDTEFLTNYLNQSDEDKSVDAMGYIESENKGGFLYVRTW